MKRKIGSAAVVVGDSFNNTLGLIRSLGEAGVNISLILVGNDRLSICKSRYLTSSQIYKVSKLDECLSILRNIGHNMGQEQRYLICTNDKAAQYIDVHEPELSRYFITPMRGSQLGEMMDKEEQCKLALECGFTVPRSEIYTKGNRFPESVPFPILLKPTNSNHGAKSDIHICKNKEELDCALNCDSGCDRFIVQEYVDKEYEINVIGVSTDHGVFVPGAVRKLRHYPELYSPCSYGVYQSVETLSVDVAPIRKFMGRVGYVGPFSVELLRKNGKDYFMECNFRHDGLAYVATAAGVNLPAMLFDKCNSGNIELKETYMMDLSTDYCHVKNGTLNRWQWARDFMRTGCQLNFNRRDPMPTVLYYWHKIMHTFHR